MYNNVIKETIHKLFELLTEEPVQLTPSDEELEAIVEKARVAPHLTVTELLAMLEHPAFLLLRR